MNHIYLDHAASTPVHPLVAETMLEIMKGKVGNASSVHAFGRDAKRIVNGARDQVSAALGCGPDELIFTSGGTESDNLALFGAATACRNAGKGKHMITAATEHHAVLHACERLEQLGFEVTYLPVDRYGQVHLEQVKEAIRPDTILISLMYGNNEVGTLHPVEAVGAVAKEHGILFHVDAVQAFGSIRLSMKDLPVDLLSVSSHKINGPQGVGALYLRRGTMLDPILYGGNQERKRRAGTENMAGLAGFAKAAEIAAADLEGRRANYETLRQTLLHGLNTEVGPEHYHVNGHPTEHLPNILNISFPEVGTETMLMNLDMEGIAVASGSACTSGSLEPSHVLEAMKLPEQFLRSAIRFSFGLGNTTQEMEQTAQKVGTILARIRNRR
ncbi:cysteine desulfurase family protein [Paenibacillus physcomitrellae]|uniref:cysteine desulfurase n=1 Tax=Paenibacillus physcomitrellae TaxID=1619311 RepID=A0ABQ1GDP5_9BACL|nr:cysteine desulfurase family protein [Paenibacillus physcomitrellae]GGA41643.1 cysteine desulfurase NifS [Paenibacillus physcomitrellae]